MLALYTQAYNRHLSMMLLIVTYAWASDITKGNIAEIKSSTLITMQTHPIPASITPEAELGGVNSGSIWRIPAGQIVTVVMKHCAEFSGNTQQLAWGYKAVACHMSHILS